MDIKDLNKPQLILLGLLLSFVTSIATSITTITLMQQAPPSVTVPINRVVKQTIEKIEQVEGKTVTQTVVVKEEDLVVDAIAKNQGAMVAITKSVAGEDGKLVEVGVGRGFTASTDGMIVADANVVSDLGLYYIKNDSGKFKADFLGTDKSGFSFLKVGAPLDDKSKFTATLPVFGDISTMKAGQKIIVLGSSISSVVFDGNKDLRLSVTKGSAGGMVLNLDGELLGMAVSGDITSFIPINIITDALKTKVSTTQAETPKTP